MWRHDNVSLFLLVVWRLFCVKNLMNLKSIEASRVHCVYTIFKWFEWAYNWTGDGAKILYTHVNNSLAYTYPLDPYISSCWL